MCNVLKNQTFFNSCAENRHDLLAKIGREVDGTKCGEVCCYKHLALVFPCPLQPFCIKFIYYEKATKFCEISTLLLTTVDTVKSKGEISQNFVPFSEYMNFTWNYFGNNLTLKMRKKIKISLIEKNNASILLKITCTALIRQAIHHLVLHTFTTSSSRLNDLRSVHLKLSKKSIIPS